MEHVSEVLSLGQVWLISHIGPVSFISLDWSVCIFGNEDLPSIKQGVFSLGNVSVCLDAHVYMSTLGQKSALWVIPHMLTTFFAF